MGFLENLKHLMVAHIRKDKNASSNFQNTNYNWDQERAQSAKEFDDSAKKAEGLAIFFIVLIAFVIIGMLYVIIKSFILCFSCNYGENKNNKMMEMILLLFGLFCFPIINVIYVFWKPTDCIKKGERKSDSSKFRSSSRSRSRSSSRGRSQSPRRRGRSTTRKSKGKK